MDGVSFSLAGAQLLALGSGALWWPETRILCVSDLLLGSATATRPQTAQDHTSHSTRDTLIRLETDLQLTHAATVVCLGDSFDMPDTGSTLPEHDRLWISRLQAGRRWVWIEGVHDAGPVALGGSHLAVLPVPPLSFRHQAMSTQSGEVSGYFHPRVQMQTRLRSTSRPAFLFDSDRVILPSYAGQTRPRPGHEDTLSTLMRREAKAIVTGPTPRIIDMPRETAV